MVRLADDAQHPADADLDVIDLPALVQSWARNVAQDWSA
jgi:hypothetical protein